MQKPKNARKTYIYVLRGLRVKSRISLLTFSLLAGYNFFIWHCIFKGLVGRNDGWNLGYGGESRYFSWGTSHIAGGKVCEGGLKGWRALRFFFFWWHHTEQNSSVANRNKSFVIRFFFIFNFWEHVSNETTQ